MAVQHTLLTGAVRSARASRSMPSPRLSELESSDVGRSARFSDGWWILPIMALGVAAWVGLFALIL